MSNGYSAAPESAMSNVEWERDVAHKDAGIAVLSRFAFLFEFHPLPHKVGTSGYAEFAAFSTEQIEQRRAVQFDQVREIEHGPQLTLDCRLDELIEISQMRTKQLAGYADGDLGKSGRNT